MTADHAAAIAAAEARLAEAQADVERLRAQLAAEQAAAQSAPRLATAEDGRAAARRRHPGRTRSEVAANGTRTDAAAYDGDAPDPYIRRTPQAEYTERHGVDITTVEGARAEARRRGAARKGGAR